jgi:hypothetical protein
MATHRLTFTPDIPEPIQRAFLLADEPSSAEENLWREVVARAVLDALGQTGLTNEPEQHIRAIREARRWFRDEPFAEDVFLMGGIGYAPVRRAVLGVRPAYTMASTGQAGSVSATKNDAT